MRSDAEPLENYLVKIEAALKQIIRAGGFALKVSVSKAAENRGEVGDPDAPQWRVDFSGPDSGLVLEGHAALLDALASVACKAARLDESLHRRIAFDCENYRRTRATELRLMAQMAAERVADTNEPFEMNPMNSAERRLVHLALKEKPEVRSESQGAGPDRRVVILPASQRKANKSEP
ncbi:MAG: protein jag [Terriglobia bacterium]